MLSDIDLTSGSALQRIQYKPLDASGKEIRVLSFDPPSRPDNSSSRLDRILGLDLAPLRFTFEQVSLDDLPNTRRNRVEARLMTPGA